MQQAGTPKTAAKNVTPTVITCGHWLQNFKYKFVFDWKLK